MKQENFAMLQFLLDSTQKDVNKYDKAIFLHEMNDPSYQALAKAVRERNIDQVKESFLPMQKIGYTTVYEALLLDTDHVEKAIEYHKYMECLNFVVSKLHTISDDWKNNPMIQAIFKKCCINLADDVFQYRFFDKQIISYIDEHKCYAIVPDADMHILEKLMQANPQYIKTFKDMFYEITPVRPTILPLLASIFEEKSSDVQSVKTKEDRERE